MQTPVVTLTLNPALDMSSEVAALIPDHKLRCSEPQLDPGGGGLNVSRAPLRHWAAKSWRWWRWAG